MDWKQYLNFEKKFGWSEIISSLALVAAIVGVTIAVISRQVMGVVISQPLTHMVDYLYDDPSGQTHHQKVFCDRISVTNTGDKKFSITGLTAIHGKQWKDHFMIGIKSDLPAGVLVQRPFDLLTSQEVTQLSPKIFYLSQWCDDLLTNPAVMISEATFGEDKLQRINILVKPGQQIMLNVGLQCSIQKQCQR